MRWIWIDRFVEPFVPRESARAVKQWSLAEDLFEQHFPDYPVVPAALIIEGLAQTGGILVGQANDFREKVVLAKIPKAVFFCDVLAGIELTYDVRLTNLRTEGAVVAGRVTAADGRPVAEAEIFFAHLDKSRSQQVFGDRNFVFSGELKHLLGLAQVLIEKQGSGAGSLGPETQ
jgi:3-hydroxyacyl-[acyl-carrier-protein] dehydratase